MRHGSFVPRVLFLCKSLPFPPRNGIELPLAHIIKGFSRQFTVDLAILSNDIDDFHNRRSAVPSSVASSRLIPTECPPTVKTLLLEVTGIRPSWAVRAKNIHALESLLNPEPYDLVWASPIGCLEILRQCSQAGHHPTRRIAVGLNEASTILYLDRSWNALRHGTPREPRHLARATRLPWMWLHERRYLRITDLIHVQSQREAERLRPLLGSNPEPRVVVSPNGRKRELQTITRTSNNHKRLLYMTLLEGGRARECYWFIRRVWPRVLDRQPTATLWVVGKPPPHTLPPSISNTPNVHFLGFVEDLPELFRQVDVSVVPTFYSTGLVNRILDSLTAGVPLVTTPQAANTISGLRCGHHALCGHSAETLAAAIIQLLQNPDKRGILAARGEQLATRHPTWEQAVTNIVNAAYQLL